MSLYQIVYCSKNQIAGASKDVESEIRSILAKSRENNQKAGISGALLFSGATFAQVLEGPLAAVEEIFEIIQCDARHSDVVMLRNTVTEDRIFSDWSMAYADPAVVHGVPRAEIGLDAAFANPAASAPLIVDLLKQLVIRGTA